MHYGHAFLLQQFADEVLIRGDHLAALRLHADGGRAIGIDVERAFGHRALDELCLIEHRDDKVAALLEGFLEHRQMILRAVQRFHRRPLGDGAGAGRLLAL